MTDHDLSLQTTSDSDTNSFSLDKIAKFPNNENHHNSIDGQYESIKRYTDSVLKYAAIVINEAEEKRKKYPTGIDDVLGLITSTAKMEGCNVWEIWRTWMMRHLIPVLYASRSEQIDYEVMESRLVDLLGFIFLALQITERGLSQQQQ